MNPIRVLLVDDEAEFTEGLTKVLGRRGLTVRAVSDAAAALSLVSRETFDVVILDVKMPAWAVSGPSRRSSGPPQGSR